MRRAPLLLLSLVVMLGGCVGLPSNGGVQEGLERAPEAEGIVFLAPDPLPGGEVEEIVSGFLDAATAGGADRYETAQKYLTDKARRSWAPGAGVTVYTGGTPPRVVERQPGIVAVTIAVAGYVDEHGQYIEEAEGSERTLTFELTVVDGQWRIDQLDDGVLISAVNFGTQFRNVTLGFHSPDHEFIIPDSRWLPEQNTASFAVNAFLGGPSPWLQPGVASVIPQGTTARPVNVMDGVAEVELSTEALQAGVRERSLIVASLEYTLTELSQVRRVHVTVDGVEYVDHNQIPQSPGTPAVGHHPTVLTADHLGVLSPTGLNVVDGVSVTDANYTGLAIPYETSDSSMVPTVVRVGKRKIRTLPRAANSTEELLDGKDLLRPTYDTYDWVWTGEKENKGTLVATRPGSDVVAVVDAPELRDHNVETIRVSRDGARIAIIQTTDEGQEIFVAVIKRDESGTPLSIGEAHHVGSGVPQASDLAWMDDVNLAVLGVDDGEATSVHSVPVGGPSVSLLSVPRATSVVAGEGERETWIATDDGKLYQRSGNGWRRVGEEENVIEVAFPG